MTDAEQPITAIYKGEAEWNWSYGRISRFFRELRDNKKIMGTKCPKCGIVFCPPTSDCPKCYVPTEWVEVSNQGTVQYYTIVYGLAAPWAKHEVPFGVGLIKLDGADTGLLHYILGVKFDELKNGIRVEAVFRDEREGYITDISHFKPV